MDESFLWKAGMTLMDMRLIAEGVALLYESDAGVVIRAAREKGLYEEANSVEMFGAALYGLRQQIRELQSAHIQEVLREGEE